MGASEYLTLAGESARTEMGGLRVPRFELTIDGVRPENSVLRDIVARPDHYRAVAAQGPAFAAAVHDGRLSAAALAGFLGRA